MFKPGVMVGLWLLALVFAVGNAVLGGLLVQPWAGEYGNHIYKSILAVCFMLFISRLHAGATRGPRALQAAWITGLCWLVMTVAFEFLAGHYLFGNPWEKLFADYRIWEGRLWPLVLAALLLGPPLTALLRGGHKQKIAYP